MRSNCLGAKAPARHAAVGALLSLLAWACGGGDATPPGVPPAGPDGGTTSVPPIGMAMRRDGGVSPDAAVGGPAGASTAKFCNALRLRDNMPIDFTLEIGNPPVRFTAASGTCTPASGTACTGIQSGTVPYRLVFMGSALEEGTIDIAAGEELFVWTTLDATNIPTIQGGILVPEAKCGTLQYTDIPGVAPPPDGGAPPRVPDGGA